MGLVIHALEKPAISRSVFVDAADGAALQRDIPLVAIPRPSALCPTSVRSPPALSPTTDSPLTVRPPTARCAPRTGGLRDRAGRHAAPGRRDVHRTAALDG